MSVPEFNIAIRVAETHGLARDAAAVRVGVPLARGLLCDPGAASLRTAEGRPVLHQGRALALWPDGTIKWLLLEALISIGAHEHCTLLLGPKGVADPRPDESPTLTIAESDSAFDLDTGSASFSLPRRGSTLIASGRLHDMNMFGASGCTLRLTGRGGACSLLEIERVAVEAVGPVAATLRVEGIFASVPGLRVPCVVRIAFVAGSAAVQLEVLLRNPRAARHKGGLWDLGDPGSLNFEDLSLVVEPVLEGVGLQWSAELDSVPRSTTARFWTVYQDSSGGVNWQSRNHVDSQGRLTTRFRGYRIEAGDSDPQRALLAEGLRATPVLQTRGASGWIAGTCEHFWQSFPKALRWHDGALEVGLFPRETGQPFELQGGEQKRHRAWLELGRPAGSCTLAAAHVPLEIAVDPRWIETTAAVPYFVAGDETVDPRYLQYVAGIITGPRSFFARRESIDEYGWRNFGELYADHEAVRHTGPEPFVSHYNNQYDFIFGACYHSLRTGDVRWNELMRDAARHTIDIDIYHTTEDRPIFNGGLFWHTDHYKPAATCTHRTYSRQNSEGRDYGGGLSNEHNYTSGLLHYYYLTGDREAAASVRGLAEWVCAMDDGARSGFALFAPGPTGLASKTVDMGFHKPGRGAGNSINALLDGYVLTGERRFMLKAEELVQRVIHPRDDIAVLQLDEPERRWSYLVFLQVLGKYLHVKLELGEADYSFWYARASLLHYARWMLEHEVPYKDVLHKVELPTETWPAHDVRKCHILHLAAYYGDAPERERFRDRAAYFFDRCLTDLLSFETRDLTRPLVILSVYGCIHGYFLKHPEPARLPAEVRHDFGVPQQFEPQRAHLAATFKRNLRLLSQELRRAAGEALYGLKNRIAP
ncbi:MAG TPA: hypothetical protein VHB68_12815 [Steroidobacteraceae bacterium]|nr:hypothetical protein [Steroidobacteraceae bacterium]